MRWRKRWERSWADVKWCSDRCRQSGVTERDAVFEQAILTLLSRRARDATICPSEAARHVLGDDAAAWRPAMEDVRRAARRLVVEGKLEIVAGGRIVDPDRARGAIRLRLARRTPRSGTA